MYLESIFIGGDIRSQLPEEAKKFDNIDRIFKRVRDQCGSGQCVQDHQMLLRLCGPVPARGSF